MELLKGNLLIITVIFCAVGFIISWSHFYEGPFQHVFEFSRKKNYAYEHRLMRKMVAVISVIGTIIYSVVCLLLKQECRVIVGFLFIVLLLFAVYFMLEGGVVRRRVIWITITMSIYFLILFLVFLAVLVWNMKLDLYSIYICGALAVFDLLSAYYNREYWKKGDMYNHIS